MQADLGGAFYEMAIRDHVRLDVLTRKSGRVAALDIELGEVERRLEIERSDAAGKCQACGAPYGHGMRFCPQCGGPVSPRPRRCREAPLANSRCTHGLQRDRPSLRLPGGLVDHGDVRDRRGGADGGESGDGALAALLSSLGVPAPRAWAGMPRSPVPGADRPPSRLAKAGSSQQVARSVITKPFGAPPSAPTPAASTTPRRRAAPTTTTPAPPPPTPHAGRIKHVFVITLASPGYDRTFGD